MQYINYKTIVVNKETNIVIIIYISNLFALFDNYKSVSTQKLISNNINL